MKPTRAARLLLVTSGFVAGVGQVLLIRELLLACFGNEVSLGLMLAAWLVCGAAGTLLASRHGQGEPSLPHTVAGAVKLAALCAPALCVAIGFVRVYQSLATVVPMQLAGLAGGHRMLTRLLTVYIAVQPGEMLGPLHLIVISLGAAVLPALVAGALFAVSLRAYGELRAGDGAAAGQAYALDAIGHLVGGVLLGWAAVTVLNPFTTACVAALTLWVAVIALARQVDAAARWPTLIGSALLAALLVGSFALQKTTAAARWHGRQLLDEVSSVYGHVAVARQGGEGVVFYENGVPTGLSPALPNVQELVQFALLQHPAPRRVLLVGGGATGGLLETLKHRPLGVDYVEIDPAVLRFAQKWVAGPDRQALDDPRVSRLVTDGRLLVKQAAAGRRPRYDVILLLLPDPSTALLNRFYTAGWFREARAALNPGGVLAWQMSSSRHYFRPSLLHLNASILQAAKAAFPRMVMMTADDSLALAVGDEQAQLTDSCPRLKQRMDKRHVRADQFAAVAPDRLDPYNKHYVLDELAKRPRVNANEDLAPIGYFYDQAVWLGFYSPAIEALYMRLGRLTLGDLVRPGIVLLVLLLLAGLHRVGRDAYVPLAILVTGALGMALELCVVFAYQAFYGYVYRQVGVIIGAFMVGLAAGASVAAALARRMSAQRRASWCLAATQGATVLLALLLPVALGRIAGGREVIALSPAAALLAFPALTILVGLAVGIQFPLAIRAVAGRADDSVTPQASAARQARAGALLYAADLIGASLGAATIGAVLIPVLGIAQTCLAGACLSGAVAGLLALRAGLSR